MAAEADVLLVKEQFPAHGDLDLVRTMSMPAIIP